MSGHLRIRIWAIAATVAALVVAAIVGETGSHAAMASGSVSASVVRDAFASEGFLPRFTFDTRTASEAQIDRLAPSLSNPNSALGKAATFWRDELEYLMFLGPTHPLTWTEYRSASPDGGIDVLVWANLNDAKTSATNMRRVQTKSVARFKKELRAPHTSGYVVDWVTARIGNVVVHYSETARSEARRARAAIARVKQTR